MFARMVLPLLGGAPAVWNTCLVFYQVALLAGYLYAHVIGTRLAVRRQVLVHGALLVAAAIALPIAVRGGGAPPASANPIGWVLQILVISLSVPFVALAATGPLLQRWFTSLNAGSPYALFAASNVGSFVALLGYPLVIEPLARLRTQSVGWTAAYAAFAALMLLCGAMAWSVATPGSAPAVPVPSDPPERARRRSRVAETIEPEDPWAARLRWLGLAAIPSTLMMSVTTFISMDVASVPLLWVAPLALYLLTFVLAFAERTFVSQRVLTALFPIAVVLIVALVLAPPVFPIVAIVLHLTSFFVVALACHTELSASRPPAESLTEFYLWLSGGGAVGGLFNALVAPFIFVNPFEYPLAAISSVLLLPGAVARKDSGRQRVGAVGGVILTVVPVLLAAAMLLFVQRFSDRLTSDLFTRYVIIFGLPSLLCFAMRKAPLRMGIALALVAVAGSFVRYDNRLPIHVERSFFGVHRVLFTGSERVLLSGTTNHGVQSVNPALRCEPLSYYSRRGPVGQFFSGERTAAGGARIGVVGLGTASLAAFAKPGQRWTFFEINPAVERLARDPRFFTYLRDCAPDARLLTGDARLMLAREPDASFDLLVLDAFSSDAIPVHLMTVEAMELYFSKLAPGGLLALHVSNRFLQLSPVVGAVARRAGLVARERLYLPTDEDRAISREMAVARWALVARSVSDFGPIATDTRWRSLDELDGPVWTDDYSNVLSVLQP